MADQSFEIPKPMREMAQKNVDQAKEAYDRFMEASRKAQEMMSDSSQTMAASGKQIQQTIFQFTQENVERGFELAQKVARAKDLQEAYEIQSSYARQQMQAYTRQAQELTRLVSEAAKRGAGD